MSNKQNFAVNDHVLIVTNCWDWDRQRGTIVKFSGDLVLVDSESGPVWVTDDMLEHRDDNG